MEENHVFSSADHQTTMETETSIEVIDVEGEVFLKPKSPSTVLPNGPNCGLVNSIVWSSQYSKKKQSSGRRLENHIHLLQLYLLHNSPYPIKKKPSTSN